MTTRTVTVTSWYSLNSEVEHLMDSLVSAAKANGNVTWTDVHPTWAAGFVGGDEGSKVAVIDVDSTDGADIAQITLWAVSNLDVDLP